MSLMILRIRKMFNSKVEKANYNLIRNSRKKMKKILMKNKLSKKWKYLKNKRKIKYRKVLLIREKIIILSLKNNLRIIWIFKKIIIIKVHKKILKFKKLEVYSIILIRIQVIVKVSIKLTPLHRK
jgi:hypothetical protein